MPDRLLRIVLCLCCVAGAGVWGQDLIDPVEEARAAYDAAVRKDAQAFDESFRGLNGRFKATLDKLCLDAQQKGELEETLVVKGLIKSVVPLATGSVFGAAASTSEKASLVVPPPPESRALAAEAYSNYVVKVHALADQFNAAASNRHARLLAAMDKLIKEQTRAGALDLAVKLRDQRVAVEQTGPPRLAAVGTRTAIATAVPAPAGVHALVGRWAFANEHTGVRVIRPDGFIEQLEGGGRVFRTNRYVVVDASTIEMRDAGGYGWTEQYRLLAPDRVELRSAHVSGKTSQSLGSREPAAVNAFLGRWIATGSTVPTREFRPDGTFSYYRQDGAQHKTGPYRLVDERTLFVPALDDWEDTYRLQGDGSAMLEARNTRDGARVTYRVVREQVASGEHPILGTWCDTWDAGYPGRTRVFEPQGIIRGIDSNGVEHVRSSYKITGPDSAEVFWPKSGTIGRYRVIPDGRLQCTNTRTNGAVETVYCTRPGVNEVIPGWAPGADAEGTWAKDWTFEGKGVQTGLAKLYSAGGRDRIWQTHPVNAATPSKWVRTVQLAPGRPHSLRLDVRSHGPQDWKLTILVNGDEVLKQVIDRPDWQTIEVNLNRYTGQKVKVEMLNGGGGAVHWAGEYGYWDRVIIE
jgi:hypothetical protein